jgi:hypothetical protein
MREIERSGDWTKIRPGQAWLIEQHASEGLSTLDRGALAGADVVLYDRALAPLIAAAVLRVGGYAEPLAADAEEGEEGGVGQAISPRALRFAADGWSVVQLVQPQCGWRKRLLRGTSKELLALRGSEGFAVRVIANTDADRCRGREARLPELKELIEFFAEGDRLTVIVGPLAAAAAFVPADVAFTANGLAG